MKLCLRGSNLIGLFLTATFVLAACTPGPKPKGPRLYQIPWPTASGEYKLQNVEIKTFTEPAKLRGEWLEVFISPSADENGLNGEKPVGRFIEKADGTLVPADLTTLQATAMYAHFERLHEIDQRLGIDSAFMWPAKAGLKVNYMDAEGAIMDNAVYDSGLNAIIMVPYTSTQLPLTLNAGILAHEHFHSIFEDRISRALKARGHRVENPDEAGIHVCAIADERHGAVDRKTVPIPAGGKVARPISNAEYNRFVLRALNEGLADFWGWMYTGDSDFISRSLEKVGSERSLDGSRDLWTEESVSQNIRYNGSQIKDAYRFGSRYARFLKNLVIAQTKTGDAPEVARFEVARALLQALNQIQIELGASFDQKRIAPELLITNLYNNLEVVSPRACDMFAIFASRGEVPQACKLKDAAATSTDAVTDSATSVPASTEGDTQ